MRWSKDRSRGGRGGGGAEEKRSCHSDSDVENSPVRVEGSAHGSRFTQSLRKRLGVDIR